MGLGIAFLLGSLLGAVVIGTGDGSSGAPVGPVAANAAAASPVSSAPTATLSSVTGGTTVAVDEGDMYLRASTTTMPAGPITFTVTNQGPSHHEFVIVSGDPTGTVGDTPGRVSEANHIGGPNGPEIGDIHPGQTKTVTATLAPGTYTAMCNFPGHYAAGMVFHFVVR